MSSKTDQNVALEDGFEGMGVRRAGSAIMPPISLPARDDWQPVMLRHFVIFLRIDCATKWLNQSRMQPSSDVKLWDNASRTFATHHWAGNLVDWFHVRDGHVSVECVEPLDIHWRQHQLCFNRRPRQQDHAVGVQR